MDDLQLIKIENIPITSIDFEWIKKELTEQLSFLDNIVYTDENIKSAKNDRAMLNKAEKLIADKLREYKKQCLEPYESIKQQVDEITSIIYGKKVGIDNTVKEYEERKKKEKEIEVRAFYDRKSIILGEYAAALYEKLFDKKWLNQSTSRSKYETEIIAAINSAKIDIDEIISWNSVFENELLDLYSKTVLLEQCLNRNNELAESVKNAGLANNNKTKESDVNSEIKTFGEGTVIKIKASRNRLSQVFDFMKALGIDYEILQELE